MERGRVWAALVVALVTGALAGSAGGAGVAPRAAMLVQSGEGQRYLPGQVVVRFRDTVDPLTRREALSSESAATIKPLGLPGMQLVRVQGSVPAAVAALSANPAVQYAEPNWIYHATAVPSDPRFGQLWGLAKINAAGAWNVTTGSAAVKVAVVDTGIAIDHPDLAANIVPGFDFVQGDADPRDFNGHGSHVAGTIGAVGDNAAGVVGVNWDVGLMPVRVLDGGGSGSSANVAAGFAYACAHGANIVNASLGGTGYSTAMRDTIASAACADTLFVVAAGNNGADNDASPLYPCNYGAPPDDLANVICVAATDENDALAPFSNYGQSVDLAAPGVNVPSTWPAYDPPLYTQGFEDPFAGWMQSIVAGGVGFGRSGTAASGTHSAADSPAGVYANGARTYWQTPGAVANLSGRIGCRAFYEIRLDTEPGHDFFYVYGSANGVDYSGSGWSGSSGGGFLGLSSDMSAFDGAAAFYVGLGLQADNDGVTGDGGYVDDLALRCLEANGEDYNTISGTSMAAPHVAGVAALVRSAHPSYTVAQLKAAVLDTTDPVLGLRGKVATGGRLDACKAVGCTTALKPPCVVPNVLGKKLRAAAQAIASRHCKLGKVTRVRSTKTRKGHVVRETPGPGRRLGNSAKVRLWVGGGR